MKVLLDENLPHALRRELPSHDVFTVQYMGWSGTKNGALLATAAAFGFDAMVTMDSGVPYQQNVTTIPLSVVVLVAPSNDIDDLLPLVPALRATLAGLPPKSIRYVS
jgi:hypothetical protein